MPENINNEYLFFENIFCVEGFALFGNMAKRKDRKRFKLFIKKKLAASIKNSLSKLSKFLFRDTKVKIKLTNW